MLTNKQIESLPSDLLKIYDDFEQSVINDIARRLTKNNRWTETAEIQAKMLRDMGYSPNEIRNKVLRQIRADKDYIKFVDENTLEYKKEVQRIIDDTLKQSERMGIVTVEEAANMSYNNDLALWEEVGKDLKKTNFSAITGTYAKELQSELKNLTKSTAFKGVVGYMNTETAFNKQLDLALVKTVSGAFSYQQAVDDVVKGMADSGLKVIYKSEAGRYTARSIDSAVRTAVLTASNRVTGEVAMKNLENSGEDLVEVSSHGGARSDGSHGPSDHAWWQGKVYSVSGKAYPKESARLGYKILPLEDATGYPNDPGGLMGYNCRHTFYTFFEGISEPNPMAKEPEPVTVDGKTYSMYQATQVQRKMERDIRATKREIVARQSCGEDITKQSIKLKSQERKYKKFSNDAGLRVENNRLGTYGFNRKNVVNAGKKSIIKSGVISGAKRTPGWENRHAKLEYEAIRKRTSDCEKIAKNTGFSLGEIKIIKSHIFIETHRFKDGTVRRFDADYEQAQAWDRLTQGTQTELDVLLLRHELEESKIMREQGLVYEDAHDITNKKYDWWKELLKERQRK